MSIEVLCNPGDVLLVPNPGFPLYQTIADYLGVAGSMKEVVDQAAQQLGVDDNKGERTLLEVAAECYSKLR